MPLRLDRIEADIREMKVDIRKLKTDVAGLKTDVADLKGDCLEFKLPRRIRAFLSQKLALRGARHHAECARAGAGPRVDTERWNRPPKRA